jgi:hypothetical protein
MYTCMYMYIYINIHVHTYIYRRRTSDGDARDGLQEALRYLQDAGQGLRRWQGVPNVFLMRTDCVPNVFLMRTMARWCRWQIVYLMCT